MYSTTVDFSPISYCLLAYEIIQLGMALEAGAGRDEANSEKAHECTRWRNTLMFKVALTAKKSLETINFAEVQG